MYNTNGTGRHEMMLCVGCRSVLVSSQSLQHAVLVMPCLLCVLQELSGDARDWVERDALVHAAMEKFRLTIRSRPDFDRGCYNLGTVFYTFAMALQGDAGRGVSHHGCRMQHYLCVRVPGQLQHVALA